MAMNVLGEVALKVLFHENPEPNPVQGAKAQYNDKGVLLGYTDQNGNNVTQEVKKWGTGPYKRPSPKMLISDPEKYNRINSINEKFYTTPIERKQEFDIQRQQTRDLIKPGLSASLGREVSDEEADKWIARNGLGTQGLSTEAVSRGLKGEAYIKGGGPQQEAARDIEATSQDVRELREYGAAKGPERAARGRAEAGGALEASSRRTIETAPTGTAADIATHKATVAETEAGLSTLPFRTQATKETAKATTATAAPLARAAIAQAGTAEAAAPSETQRRIGENQLATARAQYQLGNMPLEEEAEYLKAVNNIQRELQVAPAEINYLTTKFQEETRRMPSEAELFDLVHAVKMREGALQQAELAGQDVDTARRIASNKQRAEELKSNQIPTEVAVRPTLTKMTPGGFESTGKNPLYMPALMGNIYGMETYQDYAKEKEAQQGKTGVEYQQITLPNGTKSYIAIPNQWQAPRKVVPTTFGTTNAPSGAVTNAIVPVRSAVVPVRQSNFNLQGVPYLRQSVDYVR